MPREIPNETRFPSRNPTNQQGFVKRDCRVNSVVSETRAFRENYLSFQVDETLFPAIETLFPPIKFFLSFHLWEPKIETKSIFIITVKRGKIDHFFRHKSILKFEGFMYRKIKGMRVQIKIGTTCCKTFFFGFATYSTNFF